jgi:DGQHR domain-containing protein
MIKKAKSVGVKKRKSLKKRVPPTQQQLAQRKQKQSVRKLYETLGFTRVKVDGREFKFKTRTGELDDLFFFENVVVLVEYTVGQATTSHVTKKSLLFKLISDNPSDWIDFFRLECTEFSQAISNLPYLANQYHIKICYVSTQGVSDEIGTNFPYVYFLDGTKFRYFSALGKTIHRSARFEFFKYLEIEFAKIGENVSKASLPSTTFAGYLLPETNSSFPKGFKVVSFYADPNNLLTMSYVLRRDSWRSEDGLYQRVLRKGRMNDMRKYLTTEERVFVNNVIVTLPADAAINDLKDATRNLEEKALDHAMSVSIAIPFKSDVVGIVDGQHRVFCYHEGNDKYENNIKLLRNRQNLLVTGIVFPKSYDETAKRRFEARLFLEINDKQKKADAELKQSIEMILNPYSTIAIAKAIVQRLYESGPLKGNLQTNFFDPPNLIRTTSIVSYGLRPLVKLDGLDCLFSIWQAAEKAKLKELQKAKHEAATTEAILQDYINFCAKKINDLLIAAKLAHGTEHWVVDEFKKNTTLTPTVINGFIVCLRLLVLNKKIATKDAYEKKFSGLDKFDFSIYKSSHWRALGEKLYDQFFK